MGFFVEDAREEQGRYRLDNADDGHHEAAPFKPHGNAPLQPRAWLRKRRLTTPRSQACYNVRRLAPQSIGEAYGWISKNWQGISLTHLIRSLRENRHNSRCLGLPCKHC